MSVKIGGHRVLVKPVQLEEVDEAFAAAKRIGLEIVSTEKKREQDAVDRGIIVQIGKTAAIDFDGDLWFGEGDEILFSRYAGKTVVDPADNTKYIALNSEDVIAVISGDK